MIGPKYSAFREERLHSLKLNDEIIVLFFVLFFFIFYKNKVRNTEIK